MEFSGRVQNGVVVLDGGVKLPEGARVTVVYDAVQIRRKQGPKKRVEFPLVRTGEPGTLHLTNDRIAEILLEEDLASYRRSLGQSAADNAAGKPPAG